MATALEGINIFAALVGLLLAIASLVGVIYGVRFRVVAEAAAAEAKAHAGNTQAERERADRLERELRESKQREAEMLESLRKLESLPDMTSIADRLTQIEAKLPS